MRSRGRTALGLFAASVAALASGCGDDPTSISLHTSSSIRCSSLKGVSFTVTLPGALEGPTTTTSQCTEEVPEARIGTLVLLPGASNDAKISIVVVAGVDRPVADCTPTNAYAGCIVARRSVRFVPKREIDLAIALRAECKDVGCDGSTSCVRGECRSARVDDPTACAEAWCDDSLLEPRPATSDKKSPGKVVTLPDGGTVATLPDGGLACGASEKICGTSCVSAADPKFGCDHLGCTACVGSVVGDYTCVNDACVLLQCKSGLKTCEGVCVAADTIHGCGSSSCVACESNNGTPSCGAAGTCAIACAAGYKACNGKCVNVDDPTFGCGATSCDALACPAPGGGTLVCKLGTCAIGTCPTGTKNCNQKCVPTDANNGCESPTLCAACGPSEACQGAPTACTCVPEAATTTCAARSCGSAVNNCGQTVQCPNLCSPPNVCNGGNAGPNGCGCNPDPASATCNGVPCGTVVNNCGQAVGCPNSCVLPNVCNGAGNPNGCGCTSTFDCSQVGYCGSTYDNCGIVRYCGECGGGGGE